MKGIIWILAFIFVIPTYGISLVVAFVLASAMDKQKEIRIEEQKAQHKSKIIRFYHDYRRRQGVTESNIPSDMLFSSMRDFVIIIKDYFNRNSVSVENDEYLSYLAVKLKSYSEDNDPDDFKIILNDTLRNALRLGLKKSFEQPYIKSKHQIDIEKVNNEAHENFWEEQIRFLDEEEKRIQEQ